MCLHRRTAGCGKDEGYYYMNKFVIRQSLLLLLAATIWGVAFVAQSVGMDYIGPFTFNAVRSYIGVLVLLPCIVLLDKLKEKEAGQKTVREKENTKALFTGGIICGTILAAATSLQQIGLIYTSAGKAGFLTAMYIIMVPILGIFFKRKAGFLVWVSVIVAVAGLYLLCMTDALRLEMGDILVLLCAFIFSFHIMTVDRFSPIVNGVKLSCIQFFVCGTLCSICMFLFETPQIPQILAAWKPLLYTGALSSGVAYTLQIVGQKGMNPTVASLIMSLESVISALAGFLFLHEVLSRRELFGCILMFAAIILAQLPTREKKQEGIVSNEAA